MFLKYFSSSLFRVTADHSAATTLGKEARRWSTKIAREVNSIRENTRKLQALQQVRDSGHKVRGIFFSALSKKLREDIAFLFIRFIDRPEWSERAGLGHEDRWTEAIYTASWDCENGCWSAYRMSPIGRRFVFFDMPRMYTNSYYHGPSDNVVIFSSQCGWVHTRGRDSERPRHAALRQFTLGPDRCLWCSGKDFFLQAKFRPRRIEIIPCKNKLNRK